MDEMWLKYTSSNTVKLCKKSSCESEGEVTFKKPVSEKLVQLSKEKSQFVPITMTVS